MLDKLVAISTILGSLSLVISVIILVREVRETNRLARISHGKE